jgi:nucleoside triphosphate pyrophosphatase
MRLILASASPRRADLLRAAGIEVDVRPTDVDESIRPAESPGDYVCRVALAKARAISEGLPERLVLGADTTVVVDAAILGKPGDADDARRMLRLLSGRPHVVMTGVALLGRNGNGAVADTAVESTTVEFAPLSDQEIDWYVATDEPMGKAGAYAIQGLASRFVTRVQGSYSNVVGLPVALVYEMCTKAGLLLS